MTMKNLVGSYVVSNLTGKMGKVSAQLSETEYVVDMHSDAGATDPVVLTTSQLNSEYVVTAAAEPEPLKFNELPEDAVASMSESGRRFFDYFSAINTEYQDALKRHNPRGIREIRRKHSKLTKQLRKEMVDSLSTQEWDQVISKLAEEARTLQEGAATSFIKSMSGVEPSKNFNTLMSEVVKAYSSPDAMAGYIVQYNSALGKFQSDAGSNISKRLKRLKTDVGPYKESESYRIHLETQALAKYSEWSRMAIEVLEDDSIPAEQKHVQFLNDVVDEWIKNNQDAQSAPATSPKQNLKLKGEEPEAPSTPTPFLDEATQTRIQELTGVDKLTEFTAAIENRSLLADQASLIERGEMVGMIEDLGKSAPKGKKAKDPATNFARVIGESIYNNAAANWDRKLSSELKSVVSGAITDPSDYLSRINDFIGARHTALEQHQADLAAEYATLEERAGRPTTNLPYINFPALPGRKLEDLAIGLWLQTDFVDGLFSIIEKETGISRQDIRWGLREDLPEAVAVQWEVLRHQDPNNVDFTPVPSAAVPSTATMWGPADPKQLAGKDYVYVEPEGGKYLLKFHPPEVKKSDSGRPYKENLIDSFASDSEALTALQTYATETHEMFVSAPGESPKEFSKSEIVDHKRYRVVKPNIQSLVKSRYMDTTQANKVREALQWGKSKELDALMEQASNIVALGGHRWHVKMLNQKLANAGDLAQFFTDIFYTGEFIKGSTNRETGLSKYKDTATDYQYAMKVPGQDRPDTPLTIRKYKSNLSNLAIPDYDKPDFSGYFREVYDMVARALVSKNYAEAKDLVDAIPEQIKELEAKSSEVIAKQQMSEFIPLPPVKYEEVARDIIRGDSAFEDARKNMQSTIEALATTLAPKIVKTNLTVGAPRMANLNEMNNLKQGQPVMLAGASAVHVIVSRDDSDPFTYFVIPESSINTHDRVELISAHINNITPLKVYKVDVGDVLEVNSSLARVVDASSRDIGIVSLEFRGSSEAVPFNLEDTDVPREIKAPYKLIQCSRDGGYITPDDEINCPFHDAAGRLAPSVAHYRPMAKQACKTETQDPELEKKFRDEYEVEKLTAALKTISFEQATVAPETLPIEKEQDFDGELEIGACVKKFSSTTTGTVLGRKQACWVVAWEGGKQETCWPQELILVKE